MGVVPGVTARVEVGLEEQQAGLDTEHGQRGEAERLDAVALHALPECVPDGESVGGLDPDLVAEVAAVAGPAHGHLRTADLAAGDAEEREALHLRHERGQQISRARALEGERPDLVADLLEPDVEAPDPVGEVREVGLGARQEVLVRPWMQDDAVLEDETALVEPARVVGVPCRARSDVAGEHPGEERLGVSPRDPVLVERARVEDAGRSAHGEVLRLVAQLVAVCRQEVGPVTPELDLVQRRRALDGTGSSGSCRSGARVSSWDGRRWSRFAFASYPAGRRRRSPHRWAAASGRRRGRVRWSWTLREWTRPRQRALDPPTPRRRTQDGSPRRALCVGDGHGVPGEGARASLRSTPGRPMCSERYRPASAGRDGRRAGLRFLTLPTAAKGRPTTDEYHCGDCHSGYLDGRRRSAGGRGLGGADRVAHRKTRQAFLR